MNDYQHWCQYFLEARKQRQKHRLEIAVLQTAQRNLVHQMTSEEDPEKRFRLGVEIEVSYISRAFEARRILAKLKAEKQRRQLMSRARKRGENALLWKLSQ